MSVEAHAKEYIKTWGILLVLLVISILGPVAEIQVLTLITAFGIAIVKAYLVAAKFMHLNIEKKFVIYLLSTCLIFVMLFWFFVAPDVMKHEGQNWENIGAKKEVQRVQEAVLDAPPAEH